MDVFTSLDERRRYTMPELQAIAAAWVASGALDRRGKVSSADGHVEEADYTKQSVYAVLYGLYHAVGEVSDGRGARYEFTFNTWGYDWPERWGEPPVPPTDPQRFGKSAYTGLFHWSAVRERARARDGRVHVVELGCGTGAGADHVCADVLPRCTYEALDMQRTAVETCRREFVPRHGGRLVATCADATRAPIGDEVADVVAVCETHVTDQGELSEEDRAFFRSAHRILRRGGLFTWGNAIPDPAWGAAFAYMESIGLEVQEVEDVTEEAIRARDLDHARIAAYVEQALDRFLAFRVPVLGRRRREEAAVAMRNFARDPGTRLYEDLRTRSDTYKVVLAQKTR